MSKPAHWQLPTLDEDEVSRLAAALEIHTPAARVLVNRGYGDPASARRFLEAPLSDLHDPFLLKDLRPAVARLREAVRGREKILLYGDYDADGTTSVVLLKTAIRLSGGEVSHHVPNRLKDGYGMRGEVIEQAAADGVRLLISLDTGIRAAEAVREATRLGVDVIITDHHLPEAELPPALAVLNPNRTDDTYPDKNLCGAGVAFKLAQALLGELGWAPEKLRRITASLLKLVAIGTVADVVPLTGENRIFVKHGLEGLGTLRNPGLRALFDVAGFTEGEVPTAGQIAFRIAPRLNAAGRMADANDVIELLLTEDVTRARQLAEQLHAMNQERQKTESDIIHDILDECSRVPVSDDQAALVVSGAGWHRGVVGIVANRLVERFHRPVIVLSEDAEEGLAQGSGRSVAKFHLLEALESMPDLFTRFGGHRQAVGVSLPIEKVDEFRKRLNAYTAARLGSGDFRAHIELDAVLELREVTDESVAEILKLAPFGAGNPAPRFGIFDAEVASAPVIWKERHLRVRLRQNGRAFMCRAWNFAERIEEVQAGARVDAVVQFEPDPYSQSRGYAPWCMTLRDVREVR
jgi:single-stranded-DNA-specific exonuclease